MQIGLCSILITVTVGLFATHTRDAKEIANLLTTTEWNIHPWGNVKNGKKFRRLSAMRYNGIKGLLAYFAIDPVDVDD